MPSPLWTAAAHISTNLATLAARGCTFSVPARGDKPALHNVPLARAVAFAAIDPMEVVVSDADPHAVVDLADNTVISVTYGPAGGAWTREMIRQYGPSFVAVKGRVRRGDRVVIDEDGVASIV